MFKSDMLDFRNTFFGFKGRFNRARYWMNSVLAFAVAGALQLLVIYMFPIPEEVIAVFHSKLLQDSIVTIALASPSATFVFISTAISVKRLHDRDRSGWWGLLYLALPAVVLAAMIASADPEGHIQGWPAALMIPYLVLLIVTFTELACFKGTDGPNRYGPDRLARVVPTAHLSTAP